MKKLFNVRIDIEGAVWAEDEEEALGYANDIVEDVNDHEECAHAREIKNGPDLPAGWTGNCLVYGADEDMTFDIAWKIMEDRKGDTKTLPLPLVEKEKK
jgi:hypothetical protein